MAVVFSLIFAAFRPSFTSFHQPIHGCFEFDSGRLFELLCFLHNSLFIFRPFRPPSSSMFLIAINRGFFIILPDGSLILSWGIIFILLIRLTISSRTCYFGLRIYLLVSSNPACIQLDFLIYFYFILQNTHILHFGLKFFNP